MALSPRMSLKGKSLSTAFCRCVLRNIRSSRLSNCLDGVSGMSKRKLKASLHGTTIGNRADVPTFHMKSHRLSPRPLKQDYQRLLKLCLARDSACSRVSDFDPCDKLS